MQIEGIPDGFELVRIGVPNKGEHFVDTKLEVSKATETGFSVYPIVRLIPKSKRYRPFASAEEFKPHRDRWLENKNSSWFFKVAYYDNSFCRTSDDGPLNSWNFCFYEWRFDDGTPFGVEIGR